MQWKRRNFF